MGDLNAAYYELFRSSEAVLRAIGLPDMLGGPHLPPEVNRLISATAAVRRRQPQPPEGWSEPAPVEAPDEAAL